MTRKSKRAAIMLAFAQTPMYENLLAKAIMYEVLDIHDVLQEEWQVWNHRVEVGVIIEVAGFKFPLELSVGKYPRPTVGIFLPEDRSTSWVGTLDGSETIVYHDEQRGVSDYPFWDHVASHLVYQLKEAAR